ncbi:MAG: pyridoxamine 5'-phosphate oxidase family protein, partial [Polyangiaceae bacterium]|nr:pyridoxamine 5'-phosphate oxidase family protein [Polyangiaceae bacterium]
MPSLYRGSADDGLALFARASSMTVSGVDASGSPVLRVFNGVVVDGKLCFHGGDVGEKLELVDRPVVAMVHEIVASIPSYFVDPVLACPASTYYESAVAHGFARRVEDPAAKAAVLEALMARYQPEGGHAPIRSDDARYAAMLRTILVAEVVPERITSKRKLGQKRSAVEIVGVLEGL